MCIRDSPDRKRDASQRNVVANAQKQGQEQAGRKSKGASIDVYKRQRQDTSTSINTQMDSLIPASKIANLSQGTFVAVSYTHLV